MSWVLTGRMRISLLKKAYREKEDSDIDLMVITDSEVAEDILGTNASSSFALANESAA
jgi:predicted nucleotidyltransferase